MRKTIVIGGLAALTLTGLGGVALAQQARADANSDGRISQAEFVQARVARLTAADADGDGQVAPTERKAARDARRAERRDGRFDRLDADGDGMLSRAEFDSRDARRAQRGPRPAEMRRMARFERRGPVAISEVQSKAEAAFARLDADRDGYFTAAERQAVRAQRGERRAERMERRAARRGEQPSPATPGSE